MSNFYEVWYSEQIEHMLIINALIGIDDFDPNLQIWQICSQNWNMFQFLWNLALEQMDYASVT